jgi:hypothetical protein
MDDDQPPVDSGLENIDLEDLAAHAGGSGTDSARNAGKGKKGKVAEPANDESGEDADEGAGMAQDLTMDLDTSLGPVEPRSLFIYQTKISKKKLAPNTYKAFQEEMMAMMATAMEKGDLLLAESDFELFVFDDYKGCGFIVLNNVDHIDKIKQIVSELETHYNDKTFCFKAYGHEEARNTWNLLARVTSAIPHEDPRGITEEECCDFLEKNLIRTLTRQIGPKSGLRKPQSREDRT